jgi:hypothetical protein
MALFRAGQDFPGFPGLPGSCRFDARPLSRTAHHSPHICCHRSVSMLHAATAPFAARMLPLHHSPHACCLAPFVAFTLPSLHSSLPYRRRSTSSLLHCHYSIHRFHAAVVPLRRTHAASLHFSRIHAIAPFRRSLVCCHRSVSMLHAATAPFAARMLPLLHSPLSRCHFIALHAMEGRFRVRFRRFYCIMCNKTALNASKSRIPAALVVRTATISAGAPRFRIFSCTTYNLYRRSDHFCHRRLL